MDLKEYDSYYAQVVSCFSGFICIGAEYDPLIVNILAYNWQSNVS